MKSGKLNTNLISKLLVACSLMLGAVAAPGTSFAAGPGGLSLNLGSAVHRILGSEDLARPQTGVSDTADLRAADNINTRGFALRRDGAY